MRIVARYVHKTPNGTKRDRSVLNYVYIDSCVYKKQNSATHFSVKVLTFFGFLTQ